VHQLVDLDDRQQDGEHDQQHHTSHEQDHERLEQGQEHGQPPFQRLLEAEPEIALRVLTSKHGPVQRGVAATIERLLDAECERGALTLTIEPGVLAYVIVRIGESFLYADAIAGTEPDVGQAVEVVARLLDGAGAL